MAEQPRLARLETMTEETLQKAGIVGRRVDAVNVLLAELEAQRLARARERRAVLEEAIAVVTTTYDAPDVEYLHTTFVQEVLSRLEALRDQEEA